MTWTPDRENLLRILWTQGLSASQIAKKLGGVSRNAVVGKIHRMGLPLRETPHKQTKAEHAKNLGRVVPPVFFVDRSRETGAERGTWNVRYANKSDTHCMMFVGGESHETGLICGRAVFGDKPYCKACCKLAYLPPETKRRAA